MTESTDLSFGTILADRYQLTAEVGRGGFGMVYKARQLNMDRDVAIKILPPKFMAVADLVERFRREAQLASRLRHPNTITVHDYGQHENLLFIVMELLHGEDLADRLKREKRLPLERIVAIARQVLKSLQEAHEHGIVHRDLKPENIFLSVMTDEKDFVKVLDFGIAKLAASEPGESVDENDRQLTMMGSTVGTPTYMSPEQAAGEDVDAQTDLYALGVILYEMANGKPPFTGKNAVKTMRSHLFDPIPTFSNAKLRNTRFESMCMKALQKDRGDRFSSATEFLACLEEDLSVRTIGTIVLPGKENFDEDAPTIELVDTELGGAASSDAVSMPDTGDPVDAVLASIPLFSAKHKKANPRDAVPFSGTHDAPRESVREGASTSNLTESSDLGRALDPPRFDENPPPASISSSILTVVEEGPGEEEEEVILLTRPKRGHATPVPQEFDPDPLEESQERMMEKDRSAEWVWGEASIKVDESLERSQELQARSGAQVALPVVLLVLVLAILAGAGAWWAGWLPF